MLTPATSLPIGSGAYYHLRALREKLVPWERCESGKSAVPHQLYTVRAGYCAAEFVSKQMIALTEKETDKLMQILQKDND